jgi:hypothetical protein
MTGEAIGGESRLRIDDYTPSGRERVSMVPHTVCVGVENVGWPRLQEGRPGGDAIAKLTHHCCCCNVVADHIAYDHPDVATRPFECVVPITAHIDQVVGWL